MEDGINLIIKAYEKIDESKTWQMYLMQYQHMTAETFKSFEEFYQPLKRTGNEYEINNQSVDEILSDVKTILNKMK